MHKIFSKFFMLAIVAMFLVTGFATAEDTVVVGGE